MLAAAAGESVSVFEVILSPHSKILHTSLVKFILLFLLPLLALTACQRAPETPATTLPKTAVTLLHFFPGLSGQGLTEVTQSLNAQSTRFELKAVQLDHDALKSSIQGSVKGGHPPDLYSNWAGARTAVLVPDLEPLDDIWQQARLETHFPPELVRQASDYQGHKYLLPLTQYGVGFFYNKAVFTQHHLTPPSTWDEFLAICATLKANGVTPIALGAKDRWPVQFWFDLLLLRTAPYTFRQQLMQGQARYDDPQVKAVFALWASLLDKGYFNPDPHELGWYQGANEMVFKGSAAMTLMGTWNIDYFSDKSHRWVLGQDYDVFMFPQIRDDVPRVALGSVDGLVLPKKAINKEGAKEVLRYLAGQAPQQAFTRHSGALAPSAQVPRSTYSPIQQRLFDDIGQSAHFAFLYDLTTPHAVAELGLNAFTEFLALPKAYPNILNRLAREAAAYFQTNPAH